MNKENGHKDLGIAEVSGLDKKEVDKAMKVLKTEGKIESPKVCYWQPK